MFYHTRYDDVAPDEALDLIYTLPSGSLFRASGDPHFAWTHEQYVMANICDLLNILVLEGNGLSLQYILTDEKCREVWRMVRPGDAIDKELKKKQVKEQREKALKKAKEVRKKIEETEWEEV